MPTIQVRTPPKVIKVSTAPGLIDEFKAAFDDGLASILVERSEEISALQLCLLTRSHLMLEGVHGIAKSMLAEEAFKRVTGARIFHKMMMKTTSPDEIFGPMDSNLYRTQAIWKHNIAGMLPDCHFFFADEVYRASDQALPSMLNILNERTFINGTEKINCPLLTAVGTTNFVTDSDELAAFHDRWHVRVKVKPLESSSSLTKLFARFLKAEDAETKITTFDLDDLMGLQDAVRRVKIPKDLLEPYANLVLNLGKTTDKFISDRRKCLGLRFVQASAVLRGSNIAIVDDLPAARYGLITVREDPQESAWSSSYGKEVGTWSNTQEETKDLRILEKWIDGQERNYDDAMPTARVVDTYKKVRQARDLLRNPPPGKEPRTAAAKDRTAVLVGRMNSLMASLCDLAPNLKPGDDSGNNDDESWMVKKPRDEAADSLIET